MATRIPQIGTPYEDPNKAENAGTFNKPWFLWFQQVDAAIQTLPPAPQPPPPPTQANIQIQDDGVDVGVANPRHISFDENISVTAIGNDVHIHGTAAPTPVPPSFTLPPEFGGAYFIAIVNDNSQIYPSSSFLTSLGGTASQVVENPPTTWKSKLMRLLVSSSVASTPCGYRVATNADSGPNLSSAVSTSGGFTFGALFGTHPTTETTATTSKCIGISTFTAFSFDPTGGNWTNNAAFNTGAAFGMVSNEGDANWNFFHKAAGAVSTIIPLGIARSADQYFSFLARNKVGESGTVIQIVQLNPTTGAQTVIFNSSIPLNTAPDIYLQPFFCASATTAVLHGIVFHRALLYVPDGAFLLT